MDTTEFPRAVRTAGSLRLEVWYAGREAEPLPDRGFRRVYGYRIADTSDAAHLPVEGVDLRSGVGGRPDVEAMVRTLASFLVAAGEAFEATLRHPGTPSDNVDLFPDWVPEAAYLNSSELSMVSKEDEFEESEEPETEQAPASLASVTPADTVPDAPARRLGPTPPPEYSTGPDGPGL